ncbi:hypothetical protein Cgig2_016061 [Carnegiea gigantea]|uniref:Uncharacterized protein n=1 Tax=Carnegiea gigantea TaxID=171969 RepID=A0A9Q1JW65_9CARY|nr:hypothetical protein Cgig2_016061 [Carnegiea gigantea]
MQPKISTRVQSNSKEVEKSTSKPVLQNIHEETLEKTITNIHQQSSEEIDDTFNEAQKQTIWDMGFGGLLELQVTELPRDLYKWLIDNFDAYSLELYITSDRRIEITPMDVHLMLAHQLMEERWKSFIARSQKALNIMQSFQYGEKNEILKKGHQSSVKCHSRY